MSEYAKPTNVTNPVVDPTTYWRVSAFTLLAVALLGTVLNLVGEPDLLGAGFLAFDWTHNIVHFVLAAVALLFGFANLPGGAVKGFAIAVGAVYLGLGALGFVPAVADGLDDALLLHLELGENLVHVLLGAWGLVAGIVARY
jgi:hypothetical protein